MITDSFDIQGKPIVNLSDFYGEQQFKVEVCLITYSKEIYDAILRENKCEKIGEINASNGAFPIYQFIYKGKAVAFYLSAIGSMLASQYCMICYWVTGATKFVMFGSAGSLDNERTFNKFIIPTHSYRDEGMSYHYAPPSDYIKVKNANKVTEVFNKLALPFIEGKVWTTDAVLRETNLQYNKRKKEGCIAVDMELAGVQAVCDFHGFELFSFLVTGDVLSEGTYNVDGLKEANHNINKFHVAMNIIEELNL